MRRFVADASHELRTPLTSIRGFAELYRQGAVGSPEETARLMQRIESEGSRMGVLVEDLLQLARLDQQRPLTITPVDLAEVAGDAVHDARAVQPDRPVNLHLDESLSEVPVVLGDEARLRQVVGNLVTNALVHTPRTAPVTVRISDEPAAGDASADGDDGGDGGVVVLQVADQGPGMAPETPRGSSSASTAPTPPGPGRRAAPGWGWPSSAHWSPRTAAPCTWTPPRAGGRRSPSGCPAPARAPRSRRCRTARRPEPGGGAATVRWWTPTRAGSPTTPT
jgi:hypothetical protein